MNEVKERPVCDVCGGGGGGGGGVQCCCACCEMEDATEAVLFIDATNAFNQPNISR